MPSVNPKVVRAGEVSTVRIRLGVADAFPPQDSKIQFRCVPMDGRIRAGDRPAPPEATLGGDGDWYLTCLFEGEQEHVVFAEVALADGSVQALGQARVYSLEPDLYSRRPLKGDLHIHSNYSDGLDAPAYVVAASRRIGMDFVAVTDHHHYDPSIEAQEAFASAPVDLLICRGEEVHAPGVRTHIINFGGTHSVNALCKGSEEARAQFELEVDELVGKLGPAPDGVDAREYAGSVWVFERIRECGGLAIFCHPYWVVDAGYYHPHGPLSDHIFDRQPFDAYELIGGYHRHEADSNTLQVARYHEERAKGRALPIVGSSDAHGCDTGSLFGWYYTMVFARSPGQTEVLDAIKGLYSVAVEAMAGEVPRAYGPLRLVKYALFAMRELMPAHDDMCRTEGELMVRYVSGDDTALDLLEAARGQTARLFGEYWGPVERGECS